MYTSEIVATTNENPKFPVDVMSSIEKTMIEEVSDEIVTSLKSQDYSCIDIRVGRFLIHVRATKSGLKIEKTYDLSGTLLKSSTKNNSVHSEIGSDEHDRAHDVLASKIKEMIAPNAQKKMQPMTAATVKNMMTTVNSAMAELYPGCPGANKVIA